MFSPTSNVLISYISQLHPKPPSRSAMAFSSSLSIILSTLFCSLLAFSFQARAQTAPAPSSSGPLNLTDVLVKGGQYNTLIRLLNETRLDIQLQSQLNNTPQGLTLFAPTDNAFQNLKAGALNDLSDQQKNQLLLYHVVPQFYTLTQLLTVSNPVRTEAADSDGVWGLNFTGQGQQVNVSTGVVTVPVNNAVRQVAPLAVYQMDQVLLPEALFGNKTSKPASPPPPATSPSSSSTNGSATAPSSPSNGTGNGVRNKIGVGMVFGIGLFSLGILSA